MNCPVYCGLDLFRTYWKEDGKKKEKGNDDSTLSLKEQFDLYVQFGSVKVQLPDFGSGKLIAIH